MSIQKEFVLRYKSEGHVRFQIPDQLCDDLVAEVVSEAIAEVTGVYRVKIYKSQQKLSIRFQESICEFGELAKQLHQLLSRLEKQSALTPKLPESPQWKQKLTSKLGSFKAAKWAKEKYGDAKETVQAAKIITNIGLKTPKAFIKDPEKAITDFLTDVLVLFMIRLHWENITKLWIINPLKYRYEWMAVFYMVYLLVRSRKPK